MGVSFRCVRNILFGLNVMYSLVSILLIAVASYARLASIIESFTIAGGIIACGVFLLIISLVGMIGTLKHHQVILFFYMVMLFLIFLIQFSIAIACLALNKEQQSVILKSAWNSASCSTKLEAQNTANCCGWDTHSNVTLSCSTAPSFNPVCKTSACCSVSNQVRQEYCCTGVGNPTDQCSCSFCKEKIYNVSDEAIKMAGGIGLFFSFTEIFGVWLAVKFRNLKNPLGPPADYL